jgi:hypothetical protein
MKSRWHDRARRDGSSRTAAGAIDHRQLMPVWIGWPAGYAIAIWGIDAAYALAEPWLKQANRRVQDVAAGVRFLLPLVLAFLIGIRLRAWWWVLSPVVTVMVMMLTFTVASYLKRPPADRRQATKGLIIGIAATAFEAAMVAFAAFAGVVIGRWWPIG